MDWEVGEELQEHADKIFLASIAHMPNFVDKIRKLIKMRFQ